MSNFVKKKLQNKLEELVAPVLMASYKVYLYECEKFMKEFVENDFTPQTKILEDKDFVKNVLDELKRK